MYIKIKILFGIIIMYLDLVEVVWKFINKMLINVCNIKNIYII